MSHEPCEVKIDRTTKWGNQFKVKDHGRAKALKLYEEWLDTQILEGKLDIEELRDKVLGCWCKPKSCHGDILIRKIHQYDQIVDILDLDL